MTEEAKETMPPWVKVLLLATRRAMLTFIKEGIDRLLGTQTYTLREKEQR